MTKIFRIQKKAIIFPTGKTILLIYATNQLDIVGKKHQCFQAIAVCQAGLTWQLWQLASRYHQASSLLCLLNLYCDWLWAEHGCWDGRLCVKSALYLLWQHFGLESSLQRQSVSSYGANTGHRCSRGGQCQRRHTGSLPHGGKHKSRTTSPCLTC